LESKPSALATPSHLEQFRPKPLSFPPKFFVWDTLTFYDSLGKYGSKNSAVFSLALSQRERGERK